MYPEDMQKRISSTLFIGGTHGDEPIGMNVLRELEAKMKNLNWVVGNPKALEQGTREFEGDLNRCAPGNPRSVRYAERRAAEILQLAKPYASVVDLHGTSSKTGIFVIITRPCSETFALAARFDIQNVVIWPSFTPDLKGPLSESLPCAIEIECGSKESAETHEQLKRVLESYLSGSTPKRQQRFFEVYGTLSVADAPNMLQEFTLCEVRGEQFYPLLIGQYRAKGIACYKLRGFTL